MQLLKIFIFINPNTQCTISSSKQLYHFLMLAINLSLSWGSSFKILMSTLTNSSSSFLFYYRFNLFV
jgi:hypothetical protein